MESFVSPQAFATGAVVVLVSLYLIALPRPLPGIPYHKPAARHPLGDALSFLAYRDKEGDLSGFLPLRLRQLQSPIMQIFVQPLSRPWVVVSDPQEARDVFTRRTKEFDRSNYFGQMFESLLPRNHLHLPTGPEWKAHRWLISDTMSPRFLNEVAAPLFWSSAQDLIRLWRTKAQLAQGRPFSAAQDMYNAALEVVWHATFGFEPGSVKAQLDLLSSLPDAQSVSLSESTDSAAEFPQAKNPTAFDAIMTLADSLDIPINSIAPKIHHRLALRLSPQLRASSRQKDAVIEDRVRLAKEKVSSLSSDIQGNESYTSAVDLVAHREKILAEREGREPVYDSRIIADELFGFLIAGHETTSTTICWALKILAVEQRVQHKLRTVLRSAFANAFARGDQPFVQDIVSKDIPYFEASIAELHRKALTTPIVSRTAIVDTTILGYHIPKGTNVFFLNNGPGIQTSAMHVDDSRRSATSLRSKQKYSSWDPEDVEHFVPERWLRLNDDGEEAFDGEAGPSLPFGAGPRACFGRKWAQLELRVILILLVWNFELQPLPVELASFKAVDRNTHQPKQCYVRLAAAQ